MKLDCTPDGMLTIEPDGHDGEVTLVLKNGTVRTFTERDGKIHGPSQQPSDLTIQANVDHIV